MIKKIFILLNYSFIAILFFSACERADIDNMKQPGTSSAEKNGSAGFDGPVPLPALVPTIYFTEKNENSNRTLFYSMTNLQKIIPSINLLHAGHTNEMPANSTKNNWYMDNKNQEIVYFSNTVSNVFKEYYNRYKLSTIGEPSIKTYWGGESDAQKKYLGRGWAKLDTKNARVYYLASSTPSKYPYTNYVFDQVRSANADGSGDKIVFEQKGATWYAMDIDFINGRIYYTDFSNNSISVVGTNGSGNKMLVKNANIGTSANRRNIKVDPSKSKMYWIMDNIQKKECAIMSASTSGSDMTSLWKTKYQDAAFGLNFEVDAANQKIYFCIDKMVANNGPASYLNRMDTDGKNTKAIYKPLGSITHLVANNAIQQN